MSEEDAPGSVDEGAAASAAVTAFLLLQSTIHWRQANVKDCFTFRSAGQFRDVPLPAYVAESIDKHIASRGTTSDGYLFQGRTHKLVIRRTYQTPLDHAGR